MGFAIKQCALLFICLFQFINSHSQSTQLLNFEKFTINEGLSQGFIYNIAQDEKGFIWFCTPDGLNRYDGYHFKIYRHDYADSFSVSSNLVTKFFTDGNKNVWIATNDNGLNYFDIRYQKFYHLFSGMCIDDIAEDKYGNLILLSYDKIILGKVEIEGAENKKISIDTAVFNFPEALVYRRGFFHYYVFSDVHKNLYLSTPEAVFKLNCNGQSNKLNITKLYSFSKPGIDKPEIAEDKVSHRFYIYRQSHLLEFADSSFSAPVIIDAPPGIVHIFTNSKQRVWMQSSDGVFMLDLKMKTIARVISKSNDIDNLLETAYCSFEDKNGNLWIGTSGLGILKFTNDLNIFHHILPGKYIYNLQRYNKETALIEGMFKITFNSDNTVEMDSVNLSAKRKNFPDPAMKYVVDDKYNYWFLQDDQLQMYNAVGKKLRAVPVKEKLKKKMALPPTVKDVHKSNFIFIDRHNNLWFQCYGKMISYNINADTLAVYPSLPVFRDLDRSFRVMYEDINGTLWITASQDFYSYNPVNNKTNFFYHISGDVTSVAGSNISCFCDDPVNPSQVLWVGTRGNGVSRLNKTTGKCTSFSTKNGLPNNVIYGLLNDDKENIWGSTNKGLFRLNVKTGAIKNFDATDGLQGNEFNRYAYLKLDNGVMLFGGLNGINYFKPGEIHAIAPPPVQLTNIKLLDKNLSVNDSKALMDVDVSYLKELALQSSQNVISFEFAALDYKKTGAVYYRYKLDGFDKGWNNAGLSNAATYTNLDPGDYELEVQASNDNINWSDNILLNLLVLPMWWQTWWFKLLIAVCVSAIIYAFYRYRLQQLLHVERVRNNIARDLHDEIGSSLSSISIFSKLVQTKWNAKEESPGFLLRKINEDASRVMDSMNDIVWSINTKNDELENVFYRMREHAVQLLEAKDYTVHFYFDDKLNHVKLNMQNRRDFYLIYKEALNNVAKYACGKNVWINLSLHHNKIILNIKDDGKGFDTTAVNSGNGLSNMKKRAQEMRAELQLISELNKGTVLQLAFQKK